MPSSPTRGVREDPERVLAALRAHAETASRARDAQAGTDPVTHVERLPHRGAQHRPWPDWVPADLVDGYRQAGVNEPWSHQVEAAGLAHRGRDVVIATGTASGKSLAYQLPVLSQLLAEDTATALYLSPTKALAADQLRVLTALTPDGIRPATFDGDTPDAERDWVRAHSRLVLTNPDMLHYGMLPGHGRWQQFWRRLAFVVIDECHAYRGVFGSHVALLLRRLRRICARYRSAPVFILASATSGDPALTASRLIGRDVVAVTEDGSPRGARTFALWEPPLSPGGGENDAPVRRSAITESAGLMSDLATAGYRTLAFVRSRRGVEVAADICRSQLREADPELAGRVAAYRGGYLAEERRELEQGLTGGRLLAVASTSALELGMDVHGLDAVVMSGFPGTMASLWQQAGRAGRGGSDSLAVLVARDDPLDTYLVHHPAAVFGRPVEATVLNPENRYVLGPQLCAAAAELPLAESDVDLMGGLAAAQVLAELVAHGALRRRPTGWYWTSRQRPEADLRGGRQGTVSLVEDTTGRLLGTVDAAAATRSVHPGAVYLHQGSSYLVDELDLDDEVAVLHRASPPYSTHPREVSSTQVLAVTHRRDLGPVSLHFGEVRVHSRVVSFLRRRVPSGQVVDEQRLDLPTSELDTTAVWYTIDDAGWRAAGLRPEMLGGALHAAEHAAIGMLPLLATCDRWDIGGLSAVDHPDTGKATVFVHDGHRGGAGFAERAYQVAEQWLQATLEAVSACECSDGCPSCVQSPKCGNGNEPLDKGGALIVLRLVLQALANQSPAQA